jgi:ABC-2 type transport system permease protein
MLQTIYIMWLRELKKFWRSPSRVIGALGQPILFLLALGYGLGSVFQAAGQGSYAQFLVPGIIGMAIIFASIFNGMQIIWDRQFGFLKETLVAPVSRIAIMLGRTFGGATVATAQGCIVFVLTLLFGFHPYSWALIVPAIIVMFSIASLFSALGITVASFVKDMQGFQLVMNLLVMPMFFLSGALFPLTDVPFLLRALSTIDPLSYGVDGIRALLINVSHFGIATDATVALVIASAFLGLGSYRFTKLEV